MNSQKKFSKLIIASVIALHSISLHAESKLEEIIVTANKIEANKKDVAASVVVLDGNFLERMNVNKLEDIVSFTPNLHFTESGLSTQFRIRGIGSGNSQGFEQSVSQFVDGVSYSRAQLLRTPMFDLANIEVHSGSQNSAFGKDSIGGGVSIITSPATSERYSEINFSYNPTFNQFEQNIVFNGNISDSLNGRLSLHGLKDDGYFENTTEGQIDTDREEKFARLKLDWNVSDSFSLKTKFESGSFNSHGRAYEITQDIKSPLTLDLIARQPGNEVLKAIPSTYNNIMTVLVNQKPFESNANWQRQSNSPERSNNHINSIHIDGIYDYNEFQWQTKFSHISSGYDELCDCDYTPANVFTLKLDEKYTQTAIESYLKNDDQNGSRWLVGFYLQDSELEFHDRFFVPGDSVLKPLGNPLPGSGVNRDFTQDGLTTAIYGEYTYTFFENTEMVLGGRYTVDSKDGSRSLNIVDSNSAIISNLALACAYLYGVKVDTEQSKGLPVDCGSVPPNLTKGFSPGHSLVDTREEDSFTPFLTVKHNFDDKSNVFVTLKEGHKSGGFDPRSNSANSFEFEGESAVTMELGLRTQSEDGKFENGITFYSTEYKDLQISQYDGALGFNVGNAAETKSQGFEIDGRVIVTESIQLNYSAGYIDIEYKDFKNGNCYQFQQPDGADINGDGRADLCDYTGKDPAFVPSTTYNLGAQHNTTLFAGDLLSGIEVQYVGEHNVHENLDPKGKQNSFFILNANVRYHRKNTTLNLSANNLTNEYIKTYQSNVPLSGSQFGTNTLYTFARPERSITASISYRFE